MFELVQEVERTARKEHDCDAYNWMLEFVVNSADISDLSPEDQKVYHELCERKGKILVGEQYLHQTLKFDGELSTVKLDKRAHDLCQRYGMYPPP